MSASAVVIMELLFIQEDQIKSLNGRNQFDIIHQWGETKVFWTKSVLHVGGDFINKP